jgi:hypothetical protein
MLSLLPYESVETGPLPDDLMAAYTAAVRIVEVASSLSRCGEWPDTALSILIPTLERLEIPGDVFTLLTGNAQELNSGRDHPVVYWNIAYPNAHLVVYQLWDRLLASCWFLARSLGMIPDSNCIDRFNFDKFRLSMLKGEEHAARDWFRKYDLPSPRTLLAELALEVSKAARRRAETSGIKDERTAVDDSAFVPATRCLDTTRFKNIKRLRAALKANPWIRSRKPSGQRLDVHSGDWSRYTAMLDASGFDALDVSAETADLFMEQVRHRQAEARRSKAKR